MKKRGGKARPTGNADIEARKTLLGPALRVLRQQKNETQVALCGGIEVTKGMLSSYETGRQLPSLGSLLAVLAGLGCDFHDLQNAMDYLAGKPPRSAALVEDVDKVEAEREVGGAVITLVKHLGLPLPLGARVIELSAARTGGRKKMG